MFTSSFKCSSIEWFSVELEVDFNQVLTDLLTKTKIRGPNNFVNWPDTFVWKAIGCRPQIITSWKLNKEKRHLFLMFQKCKIFEKMFAGIRAEPAACFALLTLFCILQHKLINGDDIQRSEEQMDG